MDQYCFSYENQGLNTYLVYEFTQEDVVDSVTLGMITNNKIEGFVPVFFTQMNASRYLRYDISAQVPLRQVLSDKIKKKQVISILLGIVSAVEETEEYMIEQNELLLDLDYIFMDLSTYETRVICFPISFYGSETRDLKIFFKNLMSSIQFDSSESGDYVIKIMNHLNGNLPLSLSAFKLLLKDIQGEEIKKKILHSPKAEKQPVKQEPDIELHRMVQDLPQRLEAQKWSEQVQGPVSLQKTEVEQSQEKQISLFYLLQHYNKENAALYKAQRKEKKSNKETDNSGKAKKEKSQKQKKGFFKRKDRTPDEDMGFAVPGQERFYQFKDDNGNEKSYGSVYDSVPYSNDQPDIPAGEEMDFGETVLLDDEMTMYAVTEGEPESGYPYLLRNNNQEKVMIKKDIFKIGKDQDYADFCIKNPAVSHRHAYIIKRGNEYFIVDTKSKNHTYVNGVKIESNTEVKLENGDKISIAREELEFRTF